MKIGYLKVLEEIIKGNELRLEVDQLSPARTNDYMLFKYYREDEKTIVASKKSRSTEGQEVEIEIPLLKIEELEIVWKNFNLLYFTLLSCIYYKFSSSQDNFPPKFINRTTGEIVRSRGFSQVKSLIYYEYIGDKKKLGILVSEPLDFIVNFKCLDETWRN